MPRYYGTIFLRQRTDPGKYREGTYRIVLKTRLASVTEPVTAVKVAAESKHAGVRSLNPYGAFGRTTIVEIADSAPSQPEFGSVKYDCKPVAPFQGILNHRVTQACYTRRIEALNMNITVIGRGNVGGGLAKLWRDAGHEVAEIGHEGGDASGADVLVVAVPSDSITEALSNVSGTAGKTAIDVTNAHAGRDKEFESLSHEVKVSVDAPVAKAFNLQFASLYDQVAHQRVRPSNLYAAEDEAVEVTERLILDAGYDPVFVGGIDRARVLEDCGMDLFRAIRLSGLGPNFQRFARPGEL